MTEHYVTLFDSRFMPQGLALHHSLQAHAGKYVLWILCLDDLCLQTLSSLSLKNVKLLSLSDLETSELLEVKPDRSVAEYCWTLTPWSIQWVFETDPSAQRVTYVDADTFFLQSPSSIFDELDQSGKSVLITEHGYAPEHDQTGRSGRFCVQFMPFSRGRGENVLHWWRDRCIEWCFATPSDGHFGDQGYLEEFQPLFPDEVHVIGRDARFQAPWNASMHPASEAVIYHFHGLRIGRNTIRMSTTSPFGLYKIHGPAHELFYQRYCELLIQICDQFLGWRPLQYQESFKRSLWDRAKRRIRIALRSWLQDGEDDVMYFIAKPASNKQRQKR